MTRLYGRSRGGERCNDSASGGHWQTVTMLTAVRQEGLIRDASVTCRGAMTSELFEAWVEQVLSPCLRPGDVVVMDNLSAHKGPGVERAIEAAGASVWYLPAYSPDFNPIEKMWSKVKASLRAAAAGTLEALDEAIKMALTTVTPDDCRSYFKSCGYER